MIVYNAALKAFLLGGKNYSYAMYVNKIGMLQNLHFGAKIKESDLDYLTKTVGANGVPGENEINKDLSYNSLPAECGFFGHGDFREPTVLYTRKDGASMSRLKYASHKIVKGAHELKNMPHARGTNAKTGGADGAETLEITLKDDSAAVEVVLYYTVYADADVIVRNLEIRNIGEESLDIGRAYSFCLDLPRLEGENYSSLRLGGNWAQERIPEVAPIAHGITKLSTLRGASSHVTNPFMGILKGECSETSGECYGVQLIYSGSFSITAERTNYVPLRIQGGVSDFNFSWKLSAGESFETPQAALSYSGEGLGGMSRAHADFLRMYVINPAFVYAKRPVLINNWEATYFDFDNEKLFPIIDEAANLGLDMFVLDDGWFGARNFDDKGLGDWFVNEKKLKGGLDTIINYCKEKGLKFGLWFEPEMVNENSDLFRAHPEYAAIKPGETPTRSRNQLTLDFSKKEVVDCVYSMISALLERHDISYIKWDMNRNFSEYFSQWLSRRSAGRIFAPLYLRRVRPRNAAYRGFPQRNDRGLRGRRRQIRRRHAVLLPANLDERRYRRLRTRQNSVGHFHVLSAFGDELPRIRMPQPSDGQNHAVQYARRHRFSRRYGVRTQPFCDERRGKETGESAGGKLRENTGPCA